MTTLSGLEKSGCLVAICDQKIFLVTRSRVVVVNLATNFSTKGPVWRPQFCSRFHVRTNGTVWRPEKEHQVSENEIQNFENLSRYSRNVKGARSRYSVIFCAILLWGKILLAAVYLSKRSALNKCLACRLS